MNAVLLASVGTLLGTVLGCTTTSDESGAPITLRPLAKGAFSGIRETRQAIIKSKTDWKKFWDEHTRTVRRAPLLPAVDFRKEMVVVATMGTRRTGGYAIEITGVEVANTKLKISVKQTAPPPGAMTIQALTAPFHFVAVRRSDLKPEFVSTPAAAEK